MLVSDRRSYSTQADKDARARLPLSQRARLTELEQTGWRLRCIRSNPAQVIVASPKNRLYVLTPQGQLAEPMGVHVRYR